MARKKLTEKQARLLMANGRTEKMQGFVSKAGKKFAARLKFDDEFKVVFEFDDGPRNGSSRSEGRPSPQEKPPAETAPLTCPKCRQGQIIEGPARLWLQSLSRGVRLRGVEGNGGARN